MLCPKCGYITFDRQDTCPKCKKDWAGITDKLGGTTSSIDSFCFLGRVLGEEPETAENETHDAPLAGAEQISVPVENDAQEDGDIGTSFDEVPEIDLSGIESEVPEQETSKEVDLTFADANEQKTEATPPQPPADLQDASDQQPGLELDDIDLSDLVTLEEKSSTSAAVAETLDLDISSLEIDTPQSDSGSIDFSLESDSDSASSSDSVLDLDVDDSDEIALDLSLDLDLEAVQPEKKKSDAAIPDLGLSLELDDK